MQNEIFIQSIDIKQVRHLKNVHIPVAENERKHLILTGKNGSGKTSVLEEIKRFLEGLKIGFVDALYSGKINKKFSIRLHGLTENDIFIFFTRSSKYVVRFSF